MFTCNICLKEFSTMKSLGGHISSHNRGDSYRNGRQKTIKKLASHCCQYCKQEFETGQKLGCHTVFCKLNPNRNDTVNKIRIAMTGSKHSDETKLKISSSLKGHTGGYRRGIGRGRKGWYKGYWCDSSYELAWIIYNLDHEISFERNLEKFSYTFEGRQFNYIPDFKQNNYFVEIKGYMSKKDIEKIKQFPHKIMIITEIELRDIFKYVMNKYGKDYVTMYETTPP